MGGWGFVKGLMRGGWGALEALHIIVHDMTDTNRVHKIPTVTHWQTTTHIPVMFCVYAAQLAPLPVTGACHTPAPHQQCLDKAVPANMVQFLMYSAHQHPV